jgi:hypothetical protein
LFFDTISAYQRAEALRAAIELDLFSSVGAGRRTASDLAIIPNRERTRWRRLTSGADRNRQDSDGDSGRAAGVRGFPLHGGAMLAQIPDARLLAAIRYLPHR